MINIAVLDNLVKINCRERAVHALYCSPDFLSFHTEFWKFCDPALTNCPSIAGRVVILPCDRVLITGILIIKRITNKTIGAVGKGCPSWYALLSSRAYTK